jgi:hypothetical protein
LQKATRRAATKRHEKARKWGQEEDNLFIHKELQNKALFQMCFSSCLFAPFCGYFSPLCGVAVEFCMRLS